MEEDGNISGFVGKCSEYIDYREELKKTQNQVAENIVSENGRRSEKAESTLSSQTSEQVLTDSIPAPSAAKKKLSFKEQKEFEQLNEEIPSLEAEQKALEEKMASSDFDEVRTAGQRYKEIEALLEEKYPRWEELAERA